MNSTDYIDLLQEATPENFAKLDLSVGFVFQQDNAPIHTATRVSQFLDET